jgi:hypothetical protein
MSKEKTSGGQRSQIIVIYMTVTPISITISFI